MRRELVPRHCDPTKTFFPSVLNLRADTVSAALFAARSVSNYESFILAASVCVNDANRFFSRVSGLLKKSSSFTAKHEARLDLFSLFLQH